MINNNGSRGIFSHHEFIQHYISCLAPVKSPYYSGSLGSGKTLRPFRPSRNIPQLPLCPHSHKHVPYITEAVDRRANLPSSSRSEMSNRRTQRNQWRIRRQIPQRSRRPRTISQTAYGAARRWTAPGPVHAGRAPAPRANPRLLDSGGMSGEDGSIRGATVVIRGRQGMIYSHGGLKKKLCWLRFLIKRFY